jgi:hypothetical protein
MENRDAGSMSSHLCKTRQAVPWKRGGIAAIDWCVCITTNAIEGYFAALKRGINGVYHDVGKQHLHRYLSEFDFCYNSRIEKTGIEPCWQSRERAESS